MTLTELKYIVAVIAEAKAEGPRVRGSARAGDRQRRWAVVEGEGLA
jgi:hypothetical protein